MSQSVENSRNYAIDILKIICAFLVVCIHQPFAGNFGLNFAPITRCAVPVFFMISGYYFESICAKGKMVAQIKKILLILLFASLFYFVIRIPSNILKGISLEEYFGKCFGIKSVLEFIILNESPFYGHIWYLSALIYVMCIFYLFKEKINTKLLIYVISVLFLVNILLGNYSMIILGVDIPYIYSRNFLFLGVPYYALGIVIKEFDGKKLFENDIYKWISAIGCIGFIVTSILERCYIESSGKQSGTDHYISTVFLALSVFVFTICIGNDAKCARKDTILSKLGRDYSLGVYIIHPAVIMFLLVASPIFERILGPIWKNYGKVAPIVIMLLSVVIVWFYRLVFNFFKRRKEK